jgi:hypothetical protein
LSKADSRLLLTGRQLLARGADNHETTKKLGALLHAKTTQSRRSAPAKELYFNEYAPREVLTHLLRVKTGLPADKAY